MSLRRRRGLTEEDTALWTLVTQEVEPLKRKRRRRALRKQPEAAAEPEPPPVAPPVPPAPPPKVAAAPVKAPPRAPALTPLAVIDRHERRRVARGTKPLDGRIDLHGMRQGEAHDALRGFLYRAQAHGWLMVLVITGKGAPGEDRIGHADERGVLRRMVPQWLRLPDLRHFVVGFEEAHQGHGGSGALYVRLRRARPAGEP
jgi:DNA-nicking Smr family endonuclease